MTPNCDTTQISVMLALLAPCNLVAEHCEGCAEAVLLLSLPLSTEAACTDSSYCCCWTSWKLKELEEQVYANETWGHRYKSQDLTQARQWKPTWTGFLTNLTAPYPTPLPLAHLCTWQLEICSPLQMPVSSAWSQSRQNSPIGQLDRLQT